MANLKSAIKRARTNAHKQAQNQAARSEMRTQIKQVETFIEANDIENANSSFAVASRLIDKTVQKGIVHQNNGNRQKARLAKKISKIAQ